MRPRANDLWRGIAGAALLAGAWAVGYGSGRFSQGADRALAMARTPQPSQSSRDVSLSARFQRALELPGGLARRLALLQWQDQASDQVARELLESGKLDWSERLNVLQAWAQRDPAGCWAWQRQQPDYVVGWNVIAPEWVRRDMKGVMTALQTMPFMEKITAKKNLLQLWLSGDATLSRQIEPYLDSLSELRGSRLFSHDFPKEGRDTLTERLLALPQGWARSTLVRDYAAVLFREDWQKGLAFAQRFTGPERQALLEHQATTAFSPHAKPNPDAEAWARQWLTEEASPVARTRVAMAYLPHMAARDPAAALAWASQWLEGQPLALTVGEVMAEYGRQDAEAAKAWIQALPPTGVKRLATRRLAETWVDQEPQAAATWLLSQGPESLDQSGWASLGKKWALKQADEFKSYVMENRDSLVPDLLTGGIMILAEKDGPAAIEWAFSLPETVRTTAVDAAWVHWGRFDAIAAAAYLGAQPNDPISERAVTRFTRNWVRRDAAAATAWVTSLPNGPLREAAQRELPR